MSATLEQSLDQLDKVIRGWATMENSPTVKPTLTKRQKLWTIILEEVWPDDSIDFASTSHALDNRVEWTVKELAKWSGVRRTAWDMWAFDDKRDAEKFITLYHLVWAK